MYIYLERFNRNNTHPSKEMISVGVLQGHEGNIFFFSGEEQNWKPMLLFQMLKYYFNLNLSPLTCEILKTQTVIYSSLHLYPLS